MELPPIDQSSPHQQPPSNGVYHSPFGENGAGDGQSPFSRAQGGAQGVTPDASLAPMSANETPSPGASGGALPSLPQSGPVASPFESATPQQLVPSGSFPRVPNQAAQQPSHQPVDPPAEAQHDLPSSVLDDPRDFVEMNVLQLLGGVSPEELGASIETISVFAKTRIPMAMLKPQLPSGQVFLNVADIAVGCSGEHQSRMLGFRPDLRIKVPIGLIFPNVRAAAVTEPLPNPFEKASASNEGAVQQAEPDQVGQENPVDPVDPAAPSVSEAPPLADPPASVEESGTQDFRGVLPPLEGAGTVTPSPFESGNVADPVAETDANSGSPATFGSPLAALTPLGAADLPAGDENSAVTAASSPLPPMMPAASGETPEDVDGAVTANLQGIEGLSGHSQDVRPANAGGWPFEGGETNLPPLVNDKIESLEDLPPVSEDGDAVVPDGLDAIENPQGDQQSTLRGVFLSDDRIDASRVAAHCSELPGIESCVILGDEGKLVALAPDSVGFVEDANRLHRCLLELMATTGVADSQRLTISTDRSLVSFFAGDGFAIAVRHGREGFRPGVQERLAIVARELGNLATGQA